MIAQGSPGQLETDPHSIMGKFLAGAAGTLEDVARDPDSATGPWLAEHLGLRKRGASPVSPDPGDAASPASP
ncbi:MAG TPA: hypothetical protein VH520_12760 [Streptosporangiaceae bacterium]